MADIRGPNGVSKGPSKSGYKPADWFWESRKKGPSSAGTIVFCILRALDIPLQYYIMRSGFPDALISRLGGSPVSSVTAATAGRLGGLSPYHALVLGLATGSALKQIYWKIFINDTAMPVSFSTIVAVYNTLLNTLNTTFAFWSPAAQIPFDQSSFRNFIVSAPATLLVGLPIYTIGIFVEWYCEIQRAAFKARPENQGKPYSGGLFSLARNINYGGYTLWRTGYALICAGWGWGVVQAAWLAGDFCGRAIPSLDTYCEKRYGQQWEDVRQRVPYRLLPWIY